MAFFLTCIVLFAAFPMVIASQSWCSEIIFLAGVAVASKNLEENPDKNMRRNAQNEKSQDFCPTFMNRMEEGRRNRGSRDWIIKSRENPGSTFDVCE